MSLYRNCCASCRILAATVTAFAALTLHAATPFAWIEGESPTSINFKASQEGVGNPQFLSGTNWLKVAIDADKVEKEAPQGVLISYDFSLGTSGAHEIWARIGFEFVRSKFEWQIDSGEWKPVSPDELTSDLMELSFWTEIAWLKLGKTDISSGPHHLNIRVPKTVDDKGKVRNILFALDCVCVSSAEFHPYSHFKPGEDHQTDQDRAAQKLIFHLPEARGQGERSVAKLNGLWEICRHDEQLPHEVAAPIPDLPAQPRWTAIEVPGDKNTRPDLVFAHRLWYRTHFEVPASMIGRSFFLVFPANSLNTTIRVNDQFCGFDKNPFARLQFDITEAVKPGVNELCVGIKDAWYGYKSDPNDPLKLRKHWNLPQKYLSDGFQEFVYPLWNQKLMGIVGTPELVSAGPLYAADVFCKPSVATKSLGLEVTLQNSSPATQSANIEFEAVNDKTGQVEQKWPARTVDISTPQILSFDLAWPTAKLWWPDNPDCYRLRTTISVNSKPVDIQETLFGFREWTRDGIHLRLNGVKWQGFTDGLPGDTLDTFLAAHKSPRYNSGFARMWRHVYKWLGVEPDQALTFMDRGGQLIRLSSCLDGEAIGYMPDCLPELGTNWIDQLTAWIKGERNHPSIMIWSVENEINFINARNMGALDKWEPTLARAWEAIQKVDPTRPIMIDGGGATRAQSLPIHGDHYTTKPFWNYPKLAYEANEDQNPWTWDQKRPKFIGEELFAAGINPAYAYFGGEQVFLGKEGNRPAVGKAMQVISQGYRWFGVSACDFCQMTTDSDGSQYNEWAPRAVLVRQWDYTFASGKSATRTVGIFNNTRFADPLTFSWKLILNKKEIASHSTTHTVAPGENEKFEVQLPIPSTRDRLEGQWVLGLAIKDREIFRSVKEVSVLPSGKDLPIPSAVSRMKPTDLYVYDPKGGSISFLKAHNIPFTQLAAITPPTEPGKIWLIGEDALTITNVTSTAFAAYAAGGGRTILLEQEHPLRFGGLNPAVADYQTNVGRTAFPEDLSHPILHSLAEKDFFTWEPGEIVYKNAYLKPQRGARSLVQCNESLLNSALLTIPVNDGILTLSQLLVGHNLEANPAAQMLFINLLAFSAQYKLEFLPASVSAEPSLARILDSINLKYTAASDPLAALAKGKIAIVSATPANLKLLAQNTDKIASFNAAGGWLVLHGLTPEGLGDYNKLVGFEHMIRPFRRERVNIAIPRSKLLSGVSLSDVALYSAERIFPFQEGNFVASDTFSYIVDSDEVAPFGKWNSDAWYNFVNGMVSADGWKYIQNHPVTDSPYILTLPKPQELTAWTWDGNTFYNRTRRVELILDNDEAHKLSFDVPANGDAATFEITPPRLASKIAIRHADYDDLPDKRANGVPLVGCDNVAFFAKRPTGFRERVKPMLNSGGLVEYPRGKGGIVLANLLFKDTEEVPANAAKKRSVLTAILRNLGAPFGEGKTVIAGAHISYSPVDISKHATQYRTDRGWFGDGRFTLKDLPPGEQKLADVNWDIFEFRTSPVPTCIMLAGKNLPGQLPNEVKGIPVNRKADALFFLHTGRIDQRRNREEREKNQHFELVRYIVNYADGKQESIPVAAEIDVDDYRVKKPESLPAAQLAWTRPYEGTDEHAAVYSKQWNNPRPDVEIHSIDVVSVPNPRGTVALLAITAASAQP